MGRFISIQKLINILVEDMVSNGGTGLLTSGPVWGRNLVRSKVMGCSIGRVSSLVIHHSCRDGHVLLDLGRSGSQALHLRQVGIARVPARELVGLFADPAVALAVPK